MNKYYGFVDLEDIKHLFRSDCDGLTDNEVIFASYGSQCYDGDAIVIFERQGKYYTSEGGHCSCSGLEGQWEMIETSKEIMKDREISENYHPELVEFLKDW
jgi:hypothetical protein